MKTINTLGFFIHFALFSLLKRSEKWAKSLKIFPKLFGNLFGFSIYLCGDAPARCAGEK